MLQSRTAGSWLSARVDGRGREEIDARGRLVTPGFVDIHTHYDGQATWDARLNPVELAWRDHSGDGQIAASVSRR